MMGFRLCSQNPGAWSQTLELSALLDCFSLLRRLLLALGPSVFLLLPQDPRLIPHPCHTFWKLQARSLSSKGSYPASLCSFFISLQLKVKRMFVVMLGALPS